MENVDEDSKRSRLRVTLYNNKNYDAAIEAVTELCIEARHMKNRMYHMIEDTKK
jgi:hypothetical protein